MKTKLLKNTIALATFVLFAPLASTQFWNVINDGTDAGPDSAPFTNYVTSSWDATALGVSVFTATPSLAEVTDLEAQINTFITNEGTYKGILEAEVISNADTIVLNQAALDATNSDLADADLLVAAANDLVTSSTTTQAAAQATVADIEASDPSIDPADPLTHTPEYTAALDAKTAADDALATNVLAQTAALASQTDATTARDEAADALTASNTRATALTDAITRSDQRVTDAGAAWTTIDAAVTQKEGDFTALTDALGAFTEGITTVDPNGDVTINDLDDIINTVDALASDEDGIDDSVDLAVLPVALDGLALDTVDLDPANDPSTFNAIITEAQDALDSLTSPITAEEQNQLENALANGAFERQAITEVTGGLLLVEDTVDTLASVAVAANTTATGVNATAIADETTRATLAEGVNATAIGVNATAIADETTRATLAEGVNATAIGVNATAIADETTRATLAEGVNATAIGVNATAIADETTRATLAEGVNATAIGVNATAIADETTRATLAEGVNATAIGVNATAIADETTRATLAEGVNATAIGVNATAIADETTRATLAEGVNATAIGVNATAIADETTRATLAEGVNATAIGVNATAIADETTRATLAEGVNATAIGVNATAIADETTRATLAEGVNATAIGVNAGAIATETARATLAEGVNAAAIAAEVATRDALINRQPDGIHIGDNSFILDDTVGNHVLTTDDGTFTLGGGAVTEVDVDADLDVAGDIFMSGNLVATQLYADQAELDAIAAANSYTDGVAATLQSQVDLNRADIDRNARGIAMVAALQHTTILPGMTQALDLSAAHFEGETGMALNYARRINENVQINFGAASTSDFDESVIKGGIGWQW